MPVQYLFNSSGSWIAFRVGTYVYSTNGTWVGWLPWGDDDVVDTQGSYLGTIFYGSRLYHVYGKPYRGYPGYPPYPGYPGYPGFAGYSPLPLGARDVSIDEGGS